LIEGIPDLLETYYLALFESVENQVGPVAMLSATPAIADEALPYFKGKNVRIFPHADVAGFRAGEK